MRVGEQAGAANARRRRCWPPRSAAAGSDGSCPVRSMRQVAPSERSSERLRARWRVRPTTGSARRAFIRPPAAMPRWRHAARRPARRVSRARAPGRRACVRARRHRRASVRSVAASASGVKLILEQLGSDVLARDDVRQPDALEPDDAPRDRVVEAAHAIDDRERGAEQRGLERRGARGHRAHARVLLHRARASGHHAKVGAAAPRAPDVAAVADRQRRSRQRPRRVRRARVTKHRSGRSRARVARRPAP